MHEPSIVVSSRIIFIRRYVSPTSLFVVYKNLSSVEVFVASISILDIFFLKELIKKYATYLNVNEEELMEDFNDFVFDYTSKIPVEEIEQKVKEIEKLEEKETRKRISSPYTRKKVRNAKMKPVYFFSVITVILVSITLIIFYHYLYFII